MIARLMSRLTPEQRDLLGQVIRYGLTGGFVTLVGVGAYWYWATYLGVTPLAANAVAYLVAMILGYLLHSRFSFRGHGSRERPAARTVRFLIVSLVSFSLNSLFVWTLTGPLAGPTWWPIPFMIFVTPAVVFVLNRKWVFA